MINQLNKMLPFLKEIGTKIFNDEDINNDLRDFKDEISNELKKFTEISFNLDEQSPKNLYYKNFENEINLKSIAEISQKLKPTKANNLAVYHSKLHNKNLITLFFLENVNSPMIDFENDIFINLFAPELSEDLKSILGGKELIILN